MADPKPALSAIVASLILCNDDGDFAQLGCVHCDRAFCPADPGDKLTDLVNEGRKHAAVCEPWPAPAAPRSKSPQPSPGQADIFGGFFAR